MSSIGELRSGMERAKVEIGELQGLLAASMDKADGARLAIATITEGSNNEQVNITKAALIDSTDGIGAAIRSSMTAVEALDLYLSTL